MWKSVLKKKEWELQVNSERKSIALHISQAPGSSEIVSVRLNESELFELMHAFLSINRLFNNESMYDEELEQKGSAS
ncbi:hypothetical protein [Paenibacillus agricola]|uniref:Uncharacterized protein n=1 Tax=Paenibacillus agricola TaxID=2716264 RepID=A0ABX0J654_9BACL|nr:hypothetical protein [Paenibacillus agricola]NHN30871.1 hypothetical protein [Paenibacillus agricola]